MRAPVFFQRFVFGAALVAATSALAASPPTRIRGTVETLTGDLLTVKQADGTETTIHLPPHLSVTALANSKLSDIKAGDYVGSAAVAGADGKLHAQEVHIFSETMRGVGEGHHPMAGPSQTMTNATVATVKADPSGSTLRLTYPGGEQAIEVGPDTRIVAIIPGDMALVKPGALVAVMVNPQGDGALTARAIQAEKDGVPPL
ncbi:hypothetical protein SAMN02745157_4715 [Kaistia soli DSM 19436]|uniref:DUF5666 domain-containing protein n=1 Tax=Kaistia soli DSM 19436 TaxID=1122133 RepID=A0A1M5M8X7_9HYPH|nr:hypothetical protein [Kaistia soli]SHG73419.1 hypothetical protein SAMN02745157_4715 [Kaistia soli DSM 19436]